MLTSSRGCQTQQFHPLDIMVTLAAKIVLTYAGINKPCCWSVWATTSEAALCEQSQLQPLDWRAHAKHWTLLLCDRPSLLFRSHCILSPEYKRSILSSAQAVCSSCSSCRLEGKPLLGRLSLKAAAFQLHDVLFLLQSLKQISLSTHGYQLHQG